MTRARVKALQQKVNSLLSFFDFDSTLDGMLLHSNTLYILRYEPWEKPQDWTPRACKKGEEGREEGKHEDTREEKLLDRPVHEPVHTGSRTGPVDP